MTSPLDPRRLERINPSPTVHTTPPEKSSVRRLTSRQVGVIGTTIVDLILAQVALALGGIDILGFKPFAFLTEWGNAVQVAAADAFNKAMAAEAVANSADANQAIAFGAVVQTRNDLSATQDDLTTTKGTVQTTKTGLQTTVNGFWEASYGTPLPPGTNKSPADVYTAQVTVVNTAYAGASGAVVNGNNIQGTWDAVWNGTYNTNVSGKDITAVRTATGAIVYTTTIAGSASQTNAGNIQDTWNKIYVAAGGAGAGNRTLAEAQTRLGLLNTTAYRADENVYDTWDAYHKAIYGWIPKEYTGTGGTGPGGLPPPGASGGTGGTGPSGATGTPEDFGKGTEDVVKTIDDIDKTYKPLIPDEGAKTFGGNQISETFASYNVGALPNPPWTTNYVYPAGGYGSGTIAVDANKRAAWSGSGLSIRRGIAIYNKTQLKTKYHKVSVGLSGWPQIGASNWLYARSNSTGSTAIAARIYVNTFLLFVNVSFTVELYSVSGNTYTLITSTTTALPTTNSTWTLQCGTTDNAVGLNTYRVLCNGTQVLSRTEYGLADGGNYVGFGQEANAFILPLLPAPVNTFTAFDNIAANHLGCGYRASRATTAGKLVGTTTGVELPPDIFTTEDIPVTNTLTNNNNSRIQVSVGGWYLVTVSLAISEGLAAIRPCVLVNNEVWAKGQWANPSTSAFIVYAAADSTIAAGYEAGASVTIVGDGSGTTTYWSLTFIGNRLPTNPSDSKV